jgi:hypothetical protein
MESRANDTYAVSVVVHEEPSPLPILHVISAELMSRVVRAAKSGRCVSIRLRSAGVRSERNSKTVE